MKTNGRSRLSKWDDVHDRSRFEAQLIPGFVDEFADVPGGERLRECIQCGTCTGACPISAYMDYTPRRLIAMTRAGVREDVLTAWAPWVCTSCYSCTVACPKQIPITDIMHTLRRISLSEGTHPKRFTTPVMTGEFVKMIEKYGRSTESWISMKLYLKTQPIQLLKNAWVGGRLVRSGRLRFGRERIKDQDGLMRLLRAVNSASPAVGKAGTETRRAPVPDAAQMATEAVR